MILTAAAPGGLQVTAVDAAAAAEGLRVGMALAHARALVPHVRVAPASPERDAADLQHLAVWAGRYTPWAAVDGSDGLILDITGCAHLFGGETAMIRDMQRRLRRSGLTVRAAVADTPAAAWAWARYGEDDPVVPPGATRARLAGLPVAGLRLESNSVDALERLGLRTMGDLFGLPRSPLARRFGAALPRRLDQVLGVEPEPISPVMPQPVWQTRLSFPEPIVHRDGVEIALARLLDSLCALLRKADQGARDLTLTLGRVDCTAQQVSIGTSRPVREPAHLKRLFFEKLDAIDAGFGIETACLAATRVEGFIPSQGDFAIGDTDDQPRDASAGERVWALVDRIENRFGSARVRYVAAVESHIPERAVAALPVRDVPAIAPSWPKQDQRPLTLLPSPEPIVALAPVPDDPPVSFTWRRVVHRVARAEGPERIDPEWWRLAQPLPDRKRCRDYYRVEDADGRRFWIFREGLYGLDVTPRWFLHGVFP